MKIVIADSSTLISLLDTENFALLFELFQEIIISTEVYREISCKFHHKETIDGHLSSSKMRLEMVEHDVMYEMLIKRLDAGESESIALAKKESLPLIIDERKGRKVAQSLGIPIIGLIGIILQLLKSEVILKKEAIKIVEQIEENHFRLSKGLKSLIYDYDTPSNLE
jgi:predicted nucleic acid-binding protein